MTRIPEDLAPESRRILTAMDELGLLDARVDSVAELRAAALAERPLMGEPPTVGRVEDLEIGGPAGVINVRTYSPRVSAKRAILWLHGGGWVLGDLDHADIDCRNLCLATDSLVVSVDYRLAPEHPFPAGLEDAYATLLWISATGAADGVSEVVVGGDSSGGNLAAALCLLARNRTGPPIVAQLLVYPATDGNCDSGSHRQFGEGYLLTTDDMKWFWSMYTGSEPNAAGDPLASVLRSPELRGLPAATIVIAGCDVLRDEAESYATRLGEAEVSVEILRYPGQLHGFWTMRGVSPLPAAVDTAIAESLSRAT